MNIGETSSSNNTIMRPAAVWRKQNLLFILFVIVVSIVTVIFIVNCAVSINFVIKDDVSPYEYLKRNTHHHPHFIGSKTPRENSLYHEQPSNTIKNTEIQTVDYKSSNNRHKTIEKWKVNIDAFKTAMSDSQRQELLLTFRTLTAACYQNNLTFFLYGGSLLGSYRHHDVIPWDDDIDIMMNSSHKEELPRVLSSIKLPNYHFVLSNTSTIASKFFHRKSKLLPHQQFQWPYVDIFFFNENSTHIYDDLRQYKMDYAFPKAWVFPLVYRPFAGDSVPAPFDTRSVIDKNYSPSICKAPSFSHILESPVHNRGRSTMAIACKHLYSLHPFAFREKRSSRMHNIRISHRKDVCLRNETLKIGHKVIHTIFTQTNLCDTQEATIKNELG